MNVLLFDFRRDVLSKMRRKVFFMCVFVLCVLCEEKWWKANDLKPKKFVGKSSSSLSLPRGVRFLGFLLWVWRVRHQFFKLFSNLGGRAVLRRHGSNRYILTVTWVSRAFFVSSWRNSRAHAIPHARNPFLVCPSMPGSLSLAKVAARGQNNVSGGEHTLVRVLPHISAFQLFDLTLLPYYSRTRRLMPDDNTVSVKPG